MERKKFMAVVICTKNGKSTGYSIVTYAANENDAKRKFEEILKSESDIDCEIYSVQELGVF